VNSCLYEGTVQHSRFTPVRHAFRYRLFQMYIDLDELDEVFRGRWLWSARRPALACLLRKDHLGDTAIPLSTAVRDLVQERCGVRPLGPIRLLTHLRYFGYCMNPVSFFYCYAADGRCVDFVVAEINNTPWNERFCYVVDTRAGRTSSASHRFRKEFHVSPFMGMDIDYDWQFSQPGEDLTVHMDNSSGGERIFSAALSLKRTPISTFHLSRALLAYPLMTVQVILGIYWQALRLWVKRSPYYPHPSRMKDSEAPQ